MKDAKWFMSKALVLATLPYNGALHHYTLGPIAQIAREQDNSMRLQVLFYKFRLRKEEELRFIQIGSTLSAAAVIGVFSWPDVGESYWLARLSWHVSLWLSLFSLLSSTQSRLLEQLPNEQHNPLPESRLRLLLRMTLTSQDCRKADLESNKMSMKFAVQPDLFMLYFWQSSMMLMSYSWAIFLVGYALYLLSPVISFDTWTVEQTTALVAPLFGLICLIQFSVLNSIFRNHPLRDTLRPLDTAMYDKPEHCHPSEILSKQQGNNESERMVIRDESSDS